MFKNKSVRPVCSVVYPEEISQDPGPTFQAVPDPDPTLETRPTK
jgi:hypothetical protein